MFILLSLLTFFGFAQAQVNERGTLTRLEGLIGGMRNCQEVTAKEVTEVDACFQDLAIEKGSEKNLAQYSQAILENYVEDLFFQQLTIRSHEATTCHLSILKSYQAKSPITQQLNDTGWAIYGRMQPALTELVKMRAERSSLNDSIRMSIEPGSHTITDNQQRKRSALLREEIAAIDHAINALIAQVPFGGQKEIKEAMRSLATRGAIKEGSFQAAYASGLANLQKKMAEANNFFLNRQEKNGKSKGLYKIGRGEKIAYLQSGEADALLNEIDPKGKFKNQLSCRLKAQYKKGPATSQLVATTGLIAATLFTDGAAAPLLAVIRPLTTAALFADIGLRIKRDCFQPTTNITAQKMRSCDANSIFSTTMDEASATSCRVALAFAAIPALATVSKPLSVAWSESKSVQASTRTIANNQAAAPGLTAKETAEIAHYSPIRYYVDKLAELKELDRSNVLASTLRMLIMTRTNAVERITVPLSELHLIHHITRGPALGKTAERLESLKKIPKTSGKIQITAEVGNKYMPSKNLIRVIQDRKGEYVVFDGNGRLVAMQNAFAGSMKNVSVEVEVYRSNSQLLQRNLEALRKMRHMTPTTGTPATAAAPSH